MMIIKGSFQLSSALHVGGVDTDCCYYFYIQSNGSFGYVLDSKLEVVGCRRIEGGKHGTMSQQTWVLVLAIPDLTGCDLG